MKVLLRPFDEARLHRDKLTSFQLAVPHTPCVKGNTSIMPQLLNFSTDEIPFFEKSTHVKLIFRISPPLYPTR